MLAPVVLAFSMMGGPQGAGPCLRYAPDTVQVTGTLGKPITLRGTLSGAITGHHHAPVLLDVEEPVPGEPVQAAIDAYRVAILAAQKDPARGRLEAAFKAIAPVRAALMRERGGKRSRLESMTEQEFAALGRELPGLLVRRDEALLVEPDVRFFGRLAARGDAADHAFFAALRSTFPQYAWPVYLEQQTDVTGCTRFRRTDPCGRAAGRRADRARGHALHMHVRVAVLRSQLVFFSLGKGTCTG